MATTLIKKADALAAYLNQNCLTEDSLNGLDILDSLASLGFELTDDLEGYSSTAFFTAPRRCDGSCRPAKRTRRLLRRRPPSKKQSYRNLLGLSAAVSTWKGRPRTGEA